MSIRHFHTIPQARSTTRFPHFDKIAPKRRKVGDTLTATVVDRNGKDVSDSVTFQWYADDKAIEGETDETLDVTVGMVGSTIKVVVTAENGNTFESEETAPVEENVPVTGVKIDNETPVVGDLLTAIVEPEDATVTYQWYTGDSSTKITDAIKGANEETYEVTDAEVGKYIAVVVKSENASATAATKVAVQDSDGSDIKIASVEQTSANTIAVTLTKALGANDKVTLDKGTAAQTITTSVSDDKETVVITTSDKIINADYTVTVTPEKGDKDSETFRGESQTLAGLVWGDELALASSTDFYKAYAHLSGVDQWGDTFGVPQSKITVYASTATKNPTQAYDAAKEIVTVEKDDGRISGTSQLPFVLGDEVTLTAVYRDGTTVITQPGTLTVSGTATVADITFGELATETATLKGKPVTVDNFYNGKYYIPLDVKDSYGNALSAKELNAMVDRTLFITPKSAQAVYGGFESFDTVNGGVVMRVNSKNNTDPMPGTAVINVTSLGGYSTSTSFEIIDNLYIDSFDINVPGSLYAATPAEITIAAEDQTGGSVDIFEKFNKDTSTATTINFKDSNRAYAGANSKIDITGGTFKYDYSRTNKTVKVYVVPTAANTPVVITSTTASMTVTPQTFTVGAKGVLTKVSDALVAGTSTLVEKTHGSFNFLKAVQFEDSNGSTIDWKNGEFPLYNADPTDATGKTAGKYTWNVTNSAGTALTLAQAKATNITTDSTYTVTLYQGDGTTGVAQGDGEDVKLTVVAPDALSGNFASYRLVMGSNKVSSIHAANDVNAQKVEIKVFGTDANGNEVQLAADATDGSYALTISDAVKTTYTDADNKVQFGNATSPAIAAASSTVPLDEGDLEVTLWNASGDVAATSAIHYTNEAPKATKVEWKVKQFSTAVADNSLDWTSDAADEIKIGAIGTKSKAKWTGGVLTIEDSADGTAADVAGEKTYTGKVVDQFGQTVATSTLTIGGTAMAAEAALGTVTLTAADGKTSRLAVGSIYKDLFITD